MNGTAKIVTRRATVFLGGLACLLALVAYPSISQASQPLFIFSRGEQLVPPNTISVHWSDTDLTQNVELPTTPSYLAFWLNTTLVSFDDAKWDTFVSNVSYLTSSPMVLGIFFDSEAYNSEHNLWSFPTFTPREDRQYLELVKRRGQELKEAINGKTVGNYVSWHDVKWSPIYKTFWREVGGYMLFEDPYTYNVKDISGIKKQIRSLRLLPCAGYTEYIPRQKCQWIYNK